MKCKNIIRSIGVICLLISSTNIAAQHTVSFDVAAIRNVAHNLNGLNVSGFYHFSERFIGGLEMNRFFTVKHIKNDEEIELSAWDFDLNFHYLIPLYKKLSVYPLTGISHTSEKEITLISGEHHDESFWSYNTGAGLQYRLGKWSPHIEYIFTWGHLNQQFLLAGISYELELGKR